MTDLHEGRVRRMKVDHWSRVRARGISPYTIDRAIGHCTQLVGFYGYTVDVRAYDVRCPDGSTFRFARLKDAKTFITYHSNGLAIPAALAAGRAVG
jgi:hypothetical protein